MHYLYRYVCILNVFFICVYGQLSAIKNLLLLLLLRAASYRYPWTVTDGYGQL